MKKKKFWITFLIALVGFSALFATTSHYILNKDSIAYQGEKTVIRGREGIRRKGEILFY